MTCNRLTREIHSAQEDSSPLRLPLLTTTGPATRMTTGVYLSGTGTDSGTGSYPYTGTSPNVTPRRDNDAQCFEVSLSLSLSLTLVI